MVQERRFQMSLDRMGGTGISEPRNFVAFDPSPTRTTTTTSWGSKSPKVDQLLESYDQMFDAAERARVSVRLMDSSPQNLPTFSCGTGPMNASHFGTSSGRQRPTCRGTAIIRDKRHPVQDPVSPNCGGLTLKRVLGSNRHCEIRASRLKSARLKIATGSSTQRKNRLRRSRNDRLFRSSFLTDHSDVSRHYHGRVRRHAFRSRRPCRTPDHAYKMAQTGEGGGGRRGARRGNLPQKPSRK